MTCLHTENRLADYPVLYDIKPDFLVCNLGLLKKKKNGIRHKTKNKNQNCESKFHEKFTNFSLHRDFCFPSTALPSLPLTHSPVY